MHSHAGINASCCMSQTVQRSYCPRPCPRPMSPTPSKPLSPTLPEPYLDHVQPCAKLHPKPLRDGWGRGWGFGHVAFGVLFSSAAGGAYWPDRHSLAFPFPPSAVVPILLSPPCVLPPPPCPILPSLLSFPFPWLVVPTEPPEFPHFTALCDTQRRANVLALGQVHPSGHP